jgi:hypothetical protein
MGFLRHRLKCICPALLFLCILSKLEGLRETYSQECKAINPLTIANAIHYSHITFLVIEQLLFCSDKRGKIQIDNNASGFSFC